LIAESINIAIEGFKGPLKSNGKWATEMASTSTLVASSMQ